MRLAATFSLLVLTVILTSHFAMAEDAVFSGPQPGEKLVPFQVLAVYGESAGKEIDALGKDTDQPRLLIFVHKLTRPGMALTRGLTAYAKANQQHDVVGQIVWLSEDKAEAEAYLHRAQGSLKFVVPVGISVDGGEGPGAYGLNRNVELTILIADGDKVTANFALVQPSVSEAPKIAAELAKLIDQPAPTTDEIQKLANPSGAMRRQAAMRRNANRAQPNRAAAAESGELRDMMRKLLAVDGTETQLREAAQEINQFVGDNKTRQSALGRMSSAVLQRGIGSESAQSVIKKWRDQYEPQREPADKP